VEEREIKALNVVKTAMFVNATLAIVKIALGIIGKSIALISDGLDTTVDVVKNIIVYKGVEIAGRPQDKDHPYGHGRAETISTGIIGVSVIFAGFFIIFEAISKFGKTDVTATLMILGSSVSIIGKIILSSYMLTVGKRTSNQPLLASAKDYFGDILASAAVLFGGLLIRVTQKSYFDSIASFCCCSCDYLYGGLTY